MIVCKKALPIVQFLINYFKKSKAESLGFVDKDVYNKDIVNAIKSKNSKTPYVTLILAVMFISIIAVGYFGHLKSNAQPKLSTVGMSEICKVYK